MSQIMVGFWSAEVIDPIHSTGLAVYVIFVAPGSPKSPPNRDGPHPKP